MISMPRPKSWFPAKLSGEEKKLLEQLAEIRDRGSSGPSQGAAMIEHRERRKAALFL